jgi:ankyrin repeat protein
LIRAVRHGDVAIVRKLLTLGADPNLLCKDATWDGCSAMHVAAGNPAASPELLTCLLDHGGNPNLICPEPGSTPVLVAAKRHAIEKLDSLHQRGANVHFVSGSGYNVMIHGALGPIQSMNRLLALLLSWHVSPNQISEYGESALRILSHRGRFDCVHMLLDRGADESQLAWTALHRLAARPGEADELISRATSTELDARDWWKRTPLHVAAAAGTVDRLQQLLDAGSDPLATWHCEQTALHMAAQANRAEAIRFLVKHGLGVECTTGFGTTPLLDALSSDSLDAVRTLLELGADVEHDDSVQTSPINAAQSLAAFRMVLEAGGDINRISGDGRWPLWQAAENGDLELLGFLLEKGAQVDLTSTGATALHAAVQADSLPCIAALLAAGANVNAQDVDGWTPLFSLRSPEAAELLLQRGGNPGIADRAGMLPREWVKDLDVQAVIDQQPKRERLR